MAHAQIDLAVGARIRAQEIQRDGPGRNMSRAGNVKTRPLTPQPGRRGKRCGRSWCTRRARPGRRHPPRCRRRWRHRRRSLHLRPGCRRCRCLNPRSRLPHHHRRQRRTRRGSSPGWLECSERVPCAPCRESDMLTARSATRLHDAIPGRSSAGAASNSHQARCPGSNCRLGPPGHRRIVLYARGRMGSDTMATGSRTRRQPTMRAQLGSSWRHATTSTP